MATLRFPEPRDNGAPEDHRFGPGVPTRANAIDNRTTDIWRGTVRPDELPRNGARQQNRRGRLLGGWLLPLAVLIAVLGYLGWQRYAPALAVTGATVRTDPAGPACDGTATITGTLATNGRAGTVSYRWKRSDGTTSSTLQQHVPRDDRRTDVVLRWSFNGRGAMHATATLEVLSPDPVMASAAFTYTCR